MTWRYAALGSTDPATGIDMVCDIAVRGDRIAAVGPGLGEHAKETIDLKGRIVTPGWVDLHVHVFEWVTTFGLPPDDAGVNAGVTTAVDQGGSGAYTIPAFEHYIARPAATDIRCFPSINSAGTLRGGCAGPIIHTPDIVDVDLLVAEAAAHPRLVRGFGEIHCKSGAYSRWGFDVVRRAREASDRTGLPLYIHTGELFEVDEAHRPEPRSLLPLTCGDRAPRRHSRPCLFGDARRRPWRGTRTRRRCSSTRSRREFCSTSVSGSISAMRRRA